MRTRLQGERRMHSSALSTASTNLPGLPRSDLPPWTGHRCTSPLDLGELSDRGHCFRLSPRAFTHKDTLPRKHVAPSIVVRRCKSGQLTVKGDDTIGPPRLLPAARRQITTRRHQIHPSVFQDLNIPILRGALIFHLLSVLNVNPIYISDLQQSAIHPAR